LKKIKVLHLISGDLWAGAEVQAFTLISELNKNPELKLSTITFNKGRLSQELKQLGLPTYVFDESKNNPFQLFSKVKKVLSHEKVQILHTHRYKENIIGGIAAKLFGNIQLVKTVHGLAEPFKGIKKTKQKFYNLLDQWITKLFFHKVIGVSNQISEKLKRELPNSKVVCIHNCIALERIKAEKPVIETKKELGIRFDSVIIGTVGRLVPVKGIEYLLKSAKILGEKFPDLRLLIVGDGPAKNQLQELAKKLGINSSVIFTGHRDDVLNLVSCLDVFVLPSLSEGIPMALLEAMAVGVPVVASNVGGIPEVLEDGKTGILIPARDEKIMANVCQNLLEHKETRELLAIKAKKVVEERFSAAAMAEKVAQIYRSLVK
jgi:glycosyltransferase involved in cell wall biosynthesis